MPPLNVRTLTAPLAAFTMACLLFVYTRTSIRAAKRHATQTREADGGQISWQNESRRRHGILEKPEREKGTVRELVKEVRGELVGVGKGRETGKGMGTVEKGRGEGEKPNRGGMEEERIRARRAGRGGEE